MTDTVSWVTANGSCGFNVDGGAVQAAYVNGVALFVFESSLSRADQPFFNCVVTGHMTCGGETIEAAKDAGVRRARAWGVDGADRRLSRAKFAEVVSGQA